jgi:DNA repair ATPase RecN
LLALNQNRAREMELCQYELNELEEADLKEGEEEKFFETYNGKLKGP